MMQIIKSPSGYGDRYEMGAMPGATVSVAGIKGAAAVLHAVQGCTIETVHLRQGGPVIAGNYMPVKETNMGPTESIHGRNVPLIVNMAKQLIAERSKRKPGLIFVFTGDGPSIIEDDIARAASIIEQDLGIPAIAVDTASFLGGYARGTEMSLCAIIDRFCTESSEKRGMDIIGPHLMGSNNWPDDLEEIKRLLRAADVEINHVLFQDITVAQLPEICRAKTNYILSYEDFSEFEEKAEDLGMDVWGQDLVLPVGIHNTEEWYLTIAKEFGDEEKARAQINEDMKVVKSRTRSEYTASWMITAMFGKRVSVLGPAPFAAALARCMFYDFNMRPVVIGLNAESNDALERAEKILEPMAEYLDFEVLENPTWYSYGNTVKEAGVVFAAGLRIDEHMMEGFGVPHCSITGPYYMSHWDRIPWPYFGIRGTLYLIGEFWKATLKGLQQPKLWQMNAYQTR